MGSRGLRWSSQTIGIGRRRILPVTTRQFSSTPAQHRAHGLLSKNRASLPGTSYTALRLSQMRDSNETSQAKKEIRDRKAYEEKRRVEIKQAREEEERQRRALREARKARQMRK